MTVLEIKGVRIGEGRPKTIVSLMDEDEAGLLATAARAVEAGAELLEWRADFFGAAQDSEALVQTCGSLAEALPKTPLIFTLRTKGQGGKLELPEEEYIALCQAVIASGAPDLIDIELALGDDTVRPLVELAHEHGVRTIVSHHDFKGTPESEWMTDCLVHMARDLGADIPKLAVMPGCTQDPRRLMQATYGATEQVGVPLLTMAMGIAGQHTRLSGEVFGSALTFCALGQASAPGQVELAEAIALMDAMHRQRV